MARPSGQPAMEVTALDLVPSLRYTTWVSSRLAGRGPWAAPGLSSVEVFDPAENGGGWSPGPSLR